MFPVGSGVSSRPVVEDLRSRTQVQVFSEGPSRSAGEVISSLGLYPSVGSKPTTELSVLDFSLMVLFGREDYRVPFGILLEAETTVLYFYCRNVK